MALYKQMKDLQVISASYCSWALLRSSHFSALLSLYPPPPSLQSLLWGHRWGQLCLFWVWCCLRRACWRPAPALPLSSPQPSSPAGRTQGRAPNWRWWGTGSEMRRRRRSSCSSHSFSPSSPCGSVSSPVREWPGSSCCCTFLRSGCGNETDLRTVVILEVCYEKQWSEVTLVSSDM